MKRKYEQHYRPEWEENPLFSAWLCKCREDSYSAFCKACNTKILPRMASIKEHSNSAKHNKNMIGFSGSSQVSFSFIFILYILVLFLPANSYAKAALVCLGTGRLVLIIFFKKSEHDQQKSNE